MRARATFSRKDPTHSSAFRSATMTLRKNKWKVVERALPPSTDKFHAAAR